jgi:hypothetical protein
VQDYAQSFFGLIKKIQTIFKNHEFIATVNALITASPSTPKLGYKAKQKNADMARLINKVETNTLEYPVIVYSGITGPAVTATILPAIKICIIKYDF